MAESAAPARLVVSEQLAAAAARLAAAEHVLLTCPLRPDGDAVGSLVALTSVLEAQGKKTTLYNPDLVPRRLKWLPRARSFKRKLAAGARYQATVVVDCADAVLLGRSFPGHAITGEVIVLDHHGSSRPFGDVYVCDPGAASVGVLVARLLRQLGWPITADAAEGLYVSVVSDTGAFRYANTNAEALRLGAELVELGVDPWKVAERLFERSSVERYRLLAAALDTLERRLDGRVAFMVITHEMIKACGATWDDSVDLVSYARAVDGVECGVLLTPAKQGGTRVSMRSKGHVIDAGAVCAALGGGGHPGAAGCVLPGDLDQVRGQVEAALAQVLAAAHSDDQHGEPAHASDHPPDPTAGHARDQASDRSSGHGKVPA